MNLHKRSKDIVEHTTTIDIGDLSLIVEYIYHKGEEIEWDYPGSPSEVTIGGIYLIDSKINIYELLETSSYNFIVELEDIIIEKHQNR